MNLLRVEVQDLADNGSEHAPNAAEMQGRAVPSVASQSEWRMEKSACFDIHVRNSPTSTLY